MVRFVESNYRKPSACLNIILGISLRGKINPFAELDALYNHIFSSVEDIELTLRVISLYIVTVHFAGTLRLISMPAEFFLSLEPGDIHIALIDLSSIVS